MNLIQKSVDSAEHASKRFWQFRKKKLWKHFTIGPHSSHDLPMLCPLKGLKRRKVVQHKNRIYITCANEASCSKKIINSSNSAKVENQWLLHKHRQTTATYFFIWILLYSNSATFWIFSRPPLIHLSCHGHKLFMKSISVICMTRPGDIYDVILMGIKYLDAHVAVSSSSPRQKIQFSCRSSMIQWYQLEWFNCMKPFLLTFFASKSPARV